MSDAHSNLPTGLILASASPRRSELLERMGLSFQAIAADVDEDDSGSEGPEQMVLKNAAMKADALSADYTDYVVLGSDTTVALGDKVFSKPVDMNDARAMLTELSGRVHMVYTAVALRCVSTGLKSDFVVTSEVHFKDLNDAILEAYFAQVNPLDKAGAYGIQNGRELIIESVEGSVENVMGLPIQVLADKFTELGLDFQN